MTEATATILTDAELDFLARYFRMGKGSEIISHPPHAVIGKQCEAFHHLLDLGLLKSEPYNGFGVIRITCSDEAAQIGRERSRELMRKLLDDSERGNDQTVGPQHE